SHTGPKKYYALNRRPEGVYKIGENSAAIL
ncbi:MAG: hypothetical protein K0R45_2462, partial [Pseudomonas sp.]|nr:hypothetical protein [Pseudomonas sp.]